MVEPHTPNLFLPDVTCTIISTVKEQKLGAAQSNKTIRELRNILSLHTCNLIHSKGYQCMNWS